MIYLTITIDVEPDCTPTWHYSKPLTFDGVKIGIKEILQPLFNKYNVKPTYLINNVVLEDEESVEVFKNLDGEFELGTHLHAEFMEPYKIFYDYAGKKGEMNQCFLEPEVEYEKLRNITNLFIEKFGYHPMSFRAGRFSAGSNTIKCLSELGYKVDTSVTPHINWNDKTREKPVDFSNVYEQPFFIKENSFYENSENGKILEVPVSIINYRNIFSQKTIWLRPVYSSSAQMEKLMKKINDCYKHERIIVCNLMFHNVEVIPFKSPYTRTKEDVNKYLNVIENYLRLCISENIESVTLSKLYGIYKGKALSL